MSALNPALGVFGSIIKWVNSEYDNSDKIFVLDLVGNILPGGFTKDILYGELVDIYESKNLSESVKEVVPYNTISVYCNNCHTLTNYYVSSNGRLLCDSCYANTIDNYVMQSNIYVARNNIYTLHNSMLTSNEYHNNTLDSRELPNRNLDGRILE